jgi:hypothetical protein
MYNTYKLFETLFLASFYMVFGVFFFESSTNAQKYGEDCVDLKKWGHAYAIFA